MSPSKIQSGVYYATLSHGSIMTSVASSDQFICVTTLSESPHWYYNDSLVPSENTSNANSFINLYETGNYTCSVNTINNYTVTLTAGLL